VVHLYSISACTVGSTHVAFGLSIGLESGDDEQRGASYLPPLERSAKQVDSAPISRGHSILNICGVSHTPSTRKRSVGDLRQIVGSCGGSLGSRGVRSPGNPRDSGSADPLIRDGDTIFAHACRVGLEGIVSKRIDAPYKSGRHESWVKAK
jgi:hypothetical protein